MYIRYCEVKGYSKSMKPDNYSKLLENIRDTVNKLVQDGVDIVYSADTYILMNVE